MDALPVTAMHVWAKTVTVARGGAGSPGAGQPVIREGPTAACGGSRAGDVSTLRRRPGPGVPLVGMVSNDPGEGLVQVAAHPVGVRPCVPGRRDGVRQQSDDAVTDPVGVAVAGRARFLPPAPWRARARRRWPGTTFRSLRIQARRGTELGRWLRSRRRRGVAAHRPRPETQLRREAGERRPRSQAVVNVLGRYHELAVRRPTR
jgi:hypothetical protein